MPSLRSILLVGLPLVSAVLAQAEPHSTKRAVDNGRDPETFHELLNAVPEESLHAVLDNHMRPKYQKGVFEYDKKALERVHDDNPSLASKLVIYAAKLELLKRQNTNATVSSTPTETPAPPTTTIGSTSGETPTNTGNKETSNTPEPPSSTAGPTSNTGGNNVPSSNPPESSASPEPTPTVSVPVPVTTTDSAGNVITTSTPRPAIVISTTNSEGKATVITTPSPTLGQAITATDAKGSTFVTTYTPGGGLVSSLVLLTTTLPNGQVSTITSYQIVGGSHQTGSATGTNSNPSATKGSPNLQSGAANVLSRQWGIEAAALVGGAMGVAWML